MSDESEESCLVNSRPYLRPGQTHQSAAASGASAMPYTDGILTPGSATENSHHHHQARGQPYEDTSVVSNGAHHHQQQPFPGAIGRGSQQSQMSESGELIDYNDELMLSQFHADAIRQAGCGRFQFWTTIGLGIALGCHAMEVYSVFYILPSAEIEFCTLGGQNNWLGNIMLLGLSFGALIWGGLAGRTGRRKVLISCMGVNLVFSVIAAFMPTYGPFMMARFTAAVGMGGVFPAAISYLVEVTPTPSRARLLGMLCALGVTGGLVAGNLAVVVVPMTGQSVVVENKEHFSAWHRYLLFMALPPLMALICVCTMPESPRYLLQIGREVEALHVYQLMFRINRRHGGYAFTELEIPTVSRNQRGTTPASVLAGMAHSVNMFFGSFFGLFHPRYRRTTLLMVFVWTTALFVYHGLTVFIMEYTETINEDLYNSHRIIQYNHTYENEHFNVSIDNIHFLDCQFRNCTFGRLYLSHVEFDNCTIMDTEFANVKTSRTRFRDSLLDDVRLIDTDLTDRHFDNCSMNNMKIIRLLGSCDHDFEFNLYFIPKWVTHVFLQIPSVIIMAAVGELLTHLPKNHVAIGFFMFANVMGLVFGSVQLLDMVVWIGGTVQGFVLAGVAALTLLTVETYDTALRCSALGMFMCCGHLGALIGASIYAAVPLSVTKYAAMVTTMTLFVPILSSMMIRDSCSLL